MKFFSSLEQVNENAKCLFNLQEVEQALDVVVQQLTNDFANESPVVLGVMRGALPMMGYVVPRLSFYLEVDYVHATRYQENLGTRELMWLHEPHVGLKDRRVLLIDDILDRGITLKAIADKCYELGAKDVKIAVLCQKQIANFSPAISADYVALLVPDAYVFGYGMDYEGGWRNAPGIYELTNTSE
ncbi:hypoxanthine-guanine phosphoribosyltransferase [Cellvibrio zantedeschiae]|uniref:Hypoxanthine-guanine phosphoribosyltransferase n=1 Tax=Cellvibrio zantedeschiae TaxID=1237077 RepID=A0ABQ3B0N4_9GAMM|nr:hypoxanthine-guanine phosphoribosyltransferase [Cellvibrio zantedeschiae]GGY72690.1 hypoxanthine-guanine phosphoribosyltransferase [Cellvibrio zantedeschiae]